MRNIASMIFFGAFCSVLGCSSPPPASTPGRLADTGGWSWYSLKELNTEAGDVGIGATWGSWNKKFVYLVLMDATTSATRTISTSGARMEYKVNLGLPKGKKTELRIETSDGKTGSVAYAGQSYDLAAGPVFVLLPKGETFEVRQLKRDITDLPVGLGSVQKLLMEDQEIAEIFAKSK